MNDMVPVLVEIEATSEEAVLPIFQYLVEGSLHYIKTSKQLVAQVEVGGVTRYKDLLTGQVVADLSKSDVDKIRVNNTLRVYLRNAIARIQLSAKSPSVRESAVRSLLSKLDQETVATLESLYPNETNKKVKEAMALALAMNTAAQTTLAPSNRIAAIEKMSTSLESDVRNLLTQLTRDDNPAVVSAANDALETLSLIHI